MPAGSKVMVDDELTFTEKVSKRNLWSCLPDLRWQLRPCVESGRLSRRLHREGSGLGSETPEQREPTTSPQRWFLRRRISNWSCRDGPATRLLAAAAGGKPVLQEGDTQHEPGAPGGAGRSTQVVSASRTI